MEITQEIVPTSNQLQQKPDYADSLEPGYRFCPTDSELILDFLKRKIETGKHPKCRLYEVNIYDYNPKELTDGLRSHDNKWYFLTPRERKYPNGKQPSRKTKDFGFWKATQKYSTVYNDKVRGRVAVGRKRCLAYYDSKEEKTEWLMHEYTTNDPDLAIGTKGNKLSDWVLCRIYNKNRIDNDTNDAQHVRNTRNDEQNDHNDDEPPPIRRRLSGNREINIQPNNQDIQIQDNNGHQSAIDVQLVTPMAFQLNSIQQLGHNTDTRRQLIDLMRSSQVLSGHEGGFDIYNHTRLNTGPYPITMQPVATCYNSNVIDPTFQDPHQASTRDQVLGHSTCEYYYQHQSTPIIPTHDFQFSSGASSSYPMASAPVPLSNVQLNLQNSNQDTQNVQNIQSCPDQSMVVLQDDDWSPDDIDKFMAQFDEDVSPLDSSEYFSLEDLLDHST